MDLFNGVVLGMTRLDTNRRSSYLRNIIANLLQLSQMPPKTLLTPSFANANILGKPGDISERSSGNDTWKKQLTRGFK
jgi:hypothetical protein